MWAIETGRGLRRRRGRGWCARGFLPNLKDSTEFIQNLLSCERKGLIRETSYDIHGDSNPRNRQKVIANVREAWVKGVLENNLLYGQRPGSGRHQ